MTIIIQADREAAASYYYSAGGCPKTATAIREGRKDNWFRVQAFARHSEAERAAIVAWLREKHLAVMAFKDFAPRNLAEVADAIEAGEHLT